MKIVVIGGTALGSVTTVRASPLYYGLTVNDQSLTPGDNARLGSTRFERWLKELQ